MVRNKNRHTKEAYDKIYHTVVNFVDDSNLLVSLENQNDATHYINRYFQILIYFYSQNKLVINPDKTNLMIVARPGIRNQMEDLRIVTHKEDAYPKKQIKMLGWETNIRGSMLEI